jgi:antitoxin component YwqK of YwqJK toxin-antitoxin module
MRKIMKIRTRFLAVLLCSFFTVSVESAEEETYFLKTPLQFDARISSKFTTGRKDPTKPTIVRPHCALDFAVPTGIQVLAAADGKLTKQSEDPYRGKYVEITHNNGNKTNYYHFSKHNTRIKIGSAVKQGDLIGYVGTTGRSTGPHLHYMISQNGNYIDPAKFDKSKDSDVVFKGKRIPQVYYAPVKVKNSCTGQGTPAPDGTIAYYANRKLFNQEAWDGIEPLFYGSGKPYITIKVENGIRYETVYYENGSIKSESDGKTIKQYGENEKLAGVFKINAEEQLEGTYVVYDEKGKPAEDGNMLKGELDGEIRHYDPSGKSFSNYYFEGVHTTKEQFNKWKEERDKEHQKYRDEQNKGFEEFKKMNSM